MIRRATLKETRLIQRALNATAKIRAQAIARGKAYEKLHALADGDHLVAEVKVDGLVQTRTFILGRPKGKYVVYAELDFLENRAITKADREELRGEAH